MFTEFAANFNWIDILIGAILVRAFSIGLRSGAVIEAFKLTGMFFAIFITLHYYGALADFMHEVLRIPVILHVFLSFFFLWFGVVLIFKLIRDGWMLMLKAEDPSRFSRWCGCFLGLGRGILVCGMTFLLIFSTGHRSMSQAARQSFAGFYLMDVAVNVYSWSFETIVLRLFPSEKQNKGAAHLKDLDKKSNAKK